MKYILMLLFISSLLSAGISDVLNESQREYKNTLKIEILREDNWEYPKCIFKISDKAFKGGYTLKEVQRNCEDKLIIETAYINEDGILTDQNGEIITVDLSPTKYCFGKVRTFCLLSHDDITIELIDNIIPFPIEVVNNGYELELFTHHSNDFYLLARGFRPNEKVKCVTHFSNEKWTILIANKNGVVIETLSLPENCDDNGIATVELIGEKGSIFVDYDWKSREYCTTS